MPLVAGAGERLDVIESKAVFVSMFLMNQSPIIGPKSHSPDALLASQAAKQVVSLHLTLVANVWAPPS